MDDKVLEMVASMTRYDADMEMHKLGETIFFQSNPTAEDIDKLNNLRGHTPIMWTYEDEQVKEIIRDLDNDKFVDMFGQSK